jgi:hypothetical protein
VFERIMLDKDAVAKHLKATRDIKQDSKADVAAGQTEELAFLCQCYTRCKHFQQEYKVCIVALLFGLANVLKEAAVVALSPQNGAQFEQPTNFFLM